MELLSPNYPDSFPDDDVVEWYFEVPSKHKAAVQVLKLREPVCLKKQTAMEYHNRARGAMVVRLGAAQPEQTQGNFSLTLRNCEMDRRRSGSPGLSLSLLVSSSSESVPGLWEICSNSFSFKLNPWCWDAALTAGALFGVYRVGFGWINDLTYMLKQV